MYNCIMNLRLPLWSKCEECLYPPRPMREATKLEYGAFCLAVGLGPCSPQDPKATVPGKHSHRFLQKTHPKMTNIASVATQAAANTPLQKITTYAREPQLMIQNQPLLLCTAIPIRSSPYVFLSYSQKAHHPVPAVCGPRQMLVPPSRMPGLREAENLSEGFG